MNNKTVWYIVGAVVVVIAIVLVVMGMHGSNPGGASNTSGTVQSANTAAQPMSMKALLASGQSQMCTFNEQNSDGTNVSGVVYVTSGHMRGDFTAQESTGKSLASHMITDGTTSYVWVDGQAQGYKMSFANMDMTTSTNQQSGSVDPNQPMNYSCNGWSPDNSEFSAPSTITFTDMSAMMKGAGANVNAGASAGTGAPSNECAMCNQISNSSQKAQCLQAMGCK